MTGNTVLLGIAVGRGAMEDLARSALALAGFSVGALLGTALRRSRGVFGIEAAAIAAAVPLGALPLRLAAVATAAAAMGLQTAALRSRAPQGVRLTYITGTITTLWARVAGADDHAARLPAVVWLTYALGGAGGALLERAIGRTGLLVPAVVVAVAGFAQPRYETVERPYWTSGRPNLDSGSSSPVSSQPSRS